MEININPCWKSRLGAEFEKPYFQELSAFVANEYQTSKCFPPKPEIFAAFDACSFEDLKLVIIGQDPYHGEGQANGLCFSVNDGIAFPPSLRNIFEEIRRETGTKLPESGNLSRWANQGVLLLNSVLTVEKGNAGSHQNKGWEIFTNAVIEKISSEKSNIVFLVWGGYAKKKGAIVDHNKHLVLISGHPSPLSANRGHWFGNNHFILANNYLKANGKEEIIW